MYRHTFKAHWKLLIAPVIIGAVIAGWFTFGAAPRYRSTASLWLDNGASVGSSMDSGANTGSIGPASLESEVLAELLATPSFTEAVAKRSRLVSFYADGGSAGGFSPTALLARRHQRESPLGQAMLGVAGIKTTVVGPQVLMLEYDGPSPVVAQSVLRSLLAELRLASSKFGRSIGQAADSYYRRRLASATEVAQNTRAALSSYVRQHPSVGPEDPTYTQLSAEAQTAEARLATVKLNSSQAAVEDNSGNSADSATTLVLDPPSVSNTPTQGMSTQVTGVIAGAFGGIVLGLAALLLMAAPPRTRRWDAEMPRFERLAWSDDNLR